MPQGGVRGVLGRALIAIWLPLGLLLLGVARAPAVFPAPGQVLVAPPTNVRVVLAAPAAAGAQLQVWDTAGVNLARGAVQTGGDVLRVSVPSLAPGTYTVLWRSGEVQGSSRFTIWQGGPLPPSLRRAVRGGPDGRPRPFGTGALTALALAESVVALGGLPFGRRRSRAAQRLSCTLLAAAAGLGAVRYALWLAGGTSPLFWALLHNGIPMAGLVAALLALAALALARAPGSSALLSLGAGFSVLLTVPTVRAGGPLALAASSLALLGAGLYAGAWPHAWRARLDPAGGLRWVGLALTLLAGIPLLGLWLPLRGAAAVAAGALALGALLLGRPGSHRELPLVAASALALGAAGLLSPALAQPSPLAGRIAVDQAAGSAVPRQAGPDTVRLAVQSDQPGTMVVSVRTAAAPLNPVLTLTAASETYPGLSAALPLARLAPGLYGLRTTALSVPGPWKLSTAGATFQLTLSPAPLPDACSAGFAGYAAAEARLDGPVRVLATDPDDPMVALAATATSVFSTADGGRTWHPGGHLAGITSLAFGQHGEWLAATPQGLEASHDGGQHWGLQTGMGGPATVVASPLYPAPNDLWVLAGGRLWERGFQLMPVLPVPGWSVLGPSPARAIDALAVLPPGQHGGPSSLVASGPGGVFWSGNAGSSWQAVAAPSGVAHVSPGPDALWASGSSGVYRATSPQGPWQQIMVGLGDPAAQAAVTADGHIFVALSHQGLFLGDGTGPWSRIGCWPDPLSALAGTYHPGGPATDISRAPLVYWGDTAGQVVALLPAGALTPLRPQRQG